MFNKMRTVLTLIIFTAVLSFCSSEKKPGNTGNENGGKNNEETPLTPGLPDGKLPGDMGDQTNGKDRVEAQTLGVAIRLEIDGLPKLGITIKGDDAAAYAEGFKYTGDTGDSSEITTAKFYNPLVEGKDISGYSDVKYVMYNANGKEIDSINSGDATNDIVFTNDEFVSPKNSTDLSKRSVWETKYVGNTVRVILFFTDNGKKSYTVLPNIHIQP